MNRFPGVVMTAVLALAGWAAEAADGVAPGAPLRGFHHGEWRGTGRLIAPGPDPGAPNPTTLTMRSGTGIFRGEFRGGRFTGDYLAPACARRWTMERASHPDE